MENQVVSFGNRDIELVQNGGQYWLTGSQIGRMLEYDNAAKAIQNIYTNHKEEFTDEMSCTLKTRVQGQMHLSRLYNREGAWLIGMFARTPKAADFRKWVLRVLGAVADNQLSNTNFASVDMKAIGGMVKKCCAVAVRDEVKEQINNLILRTEPLKPFQDVSDETLLRGLYDWYATRHKDYIKTITDLTNENDLLKSKIAAIKKTIN